MVKSFDCVKCGGHHPRPINRNCKLVQETDQEQEMDTNVMILKELKTLNSRMTEMESKVQALDAVRYPSTSSTSRRSRKDSETDMVLPSLEGLRSSREIQDQVEAKIKALQNSHERGGTKTVSVKKEVPWPQNYILGGTNKSRVSYDRL